MTKLDFREYTDLIYKLNTASTIVLILGLIISIINFCYLCDFVS